MMREKTIFDGVIEASIKDFFEQVNSFYFINKIFDFDIQREYENIGSKTVEKIVFDNGTKQIINGFYYIFPMTITKEPIIKLMIVSCREELDIIYFQLSQFIQAKFVIPEFPPRLLTIPLKDLYKEGIIITEDILPKNDLSSLPDPDDEKKYGTDRNLSKKEVIRLVSLCRAYMKRDGTIEEFYKTYAEQNCELETFRKWVKDKKFNSFAP